MTTTTLPFTITCPPWCIKKAEEHAADLWETGGNCYHGSETVEVVDRLVELYRSTGGKA